MSGTTRHCHAVLRALKALRVITRMGWLRSVGSMKIIGLVCSWKLQVPFAEYRLFYRALLQKRPVILWILLTGATPYMYVGTFRPDSAPSLSVIMTIAFITINSGLVPLIEGLCAQILYFRCDIIGGSHVCIDIQTYIYIYIYRIWTCSRHLNVRNCFLYIHVSIYKYMYIYICVYTHIYTSIYIHICIYIYIYMCGYD